LSKLFDHNRAGNSRCCVYQVVLDGATILDELREVGDLLLVRTSLDVQREPDFLEAAANVRCTFPKLSAFQNGGEVPRRAFCRTASW
jgi:hypothetical protein